MKIFIFIVLYFYFFVYFETVQINIQGCIWRTLSCSESTMAGTSNSLNSTTFNFWLWLKTWGFDRSLAEDLALIGLLIWICFIHTVWHFWMCDQLNFWLLLVLLDYCRYIRLYIYKLYIPLLCYIIDPRSYKCISHIDLYMLLYIICSYIYIHPYYSISYRSYMYPM